MTDDPEKTGSEKRKYRLELSRTALFFWAFGLFILLAWTFTLGVLAGRGLLPSGAGTLSELKNQILRLQDMVGRKDASELERIRELHKDPQFAFYQELSSEKKPDEPKAPSPAPAPVSAEKPKPQPEVNEKFVVQVASLDSEKQAKGMVERLAKKGYPAYYYKVFVKGRSYFRVRCGTFKTKLEADDTLQKLKQRERLKGYVKKVNPSP